MRSAVLGAVLLIIGGVAIAVGLLPPAAALGVADRVWPILLFVVAITVVTELSAEAGLFRVVAEHTAGWGRGRGWILWMLVLAIAVVSTVFLSIDTTAVLLTPVVVLLARHVGMPPLPFALVTVWMANTASMLLPVSNLTNLLSASDIGGGHPVGFARMVLAPAIIGVVVPAAVLFVLFRRQLLVRYTVEPESDAPPDDRVLLIASGVTVVALIPLLVSGIPVWLPSLGAALVLGAFFAARHREVLRFGLLPWKLVLLASGLFLVVEAGHSLGLTILLAGVSGTGSDPVSLVRLAAVGAFGANAINNLPAYLALEPVAGSPLRLAALLVGVNIGPLITPWASLATLLWHERLVALGVPLSWRRYGLLGLAVAPVTVVLATIALALTN